MSFFTSEGVAVAAGYDQADRFLTDVRRHEWPIYPLRHANGRHLYGAAELAIAAVVHRLICFGVPAAKIGPVLRRINHETLAAAVDRVAGGEERQLVIVISAFAGDPTDAATAVHSYRDAADILENEGDALLIDLTDFARGFVVC